MHLKAGALTRFETWLPPNQMAKAYQYSITDSSGQLVRNSKGQSGSQSRRPYAFAVTLPDGTYTVEFAADTTFAGKATSTVNGTQQEQTVRIDLSAR